MKESGIIITSWKKMLTKEKKISCNARLLGYVTLLTVMEKHGIRHSNILCIFEGCGEEKEDNKSFETLTQRKRQQQ